MKVKELIKELQKYPEDLNIDCNDGHGTYSDIKEVKRQSWSDRAGNAYDTVTIIHYGYNKDNARIVPEVDSVPESIPYTLEDWSKVLDSPVTYQKEDILPEPVPPLKVGDYVKIIACTNKDTAYIYLNKVGKITDIWPENRFGEYCVELPGGYNNCFFGNQIEPVASIHVHSREIKS